MRHLAIIGGGFAGTMAAIHALRIANEHCILHWYEGSGTFGRGVAYGTNDKSHLLNVRAGKMGATPNDIGGFFQWLQHHHSQRFTAHDFVPRMLYGDYIEHLLHDALKHDTHIALRKHASVITHIEQTPEGLKLFPERLEPVLVEKLILASGNESPNIPAFVTPEIQEHAGFVANPWDTPAGSVLNMPEHTFKGRACIIGSGLTAVDIALSVLSRHPQCKVVVVSRHGLLPAHHNEEGPPAPALPQPLPTTTLGWWRLIRQQVREHEAQGGNWRAVIDGLRPHTANAWRALSEAEKARAYRHTLSHWNIHRHRMAQNIADTWNARTEAKRLMQLAGHVQPITLTDEGRMNICVRKLGMEFDIMADALILCNGPQQRLGRSANPLLQQMMQDGLLRPGPVGMGAALASDHTATGIATGRIYPMGTLIAGEWLECTAVPELRGQALKAAEWLVA